MTPDELIQQVRGRLTAARVRPIELAEAIGQSQQQASQLLSGARRITIDHLPGIAAVLGCAVRDVFGPVPEKSAGPDLSHGSGRVSSGHGGAAPTASSEAPTYAASSPASDFSGDPDALVKDIQLRAYTIRGAADALYEHAVWLEKLAAQILRGQAPDRRRDRPPRPLKHRKHA